MFGTKIFLATHRNEFIKILKSWPLDKIKDEIKIIVDNANTNNEMR